MAAVDTNVLIYSHDPRDTRKQTIALSILNSLKDGVLLWQVACEFVAASRKLEPFGLTQAQARHEIEALRRVWASLLPSWEAITSLQYFQNAIDEAGRLQMPEDYWRYLRLRVDRFEQQWLATKRNVAG